MEGKAAYQELSDLLTQLGCPPLPADHPIYSEEPSITLSSPTPAPLPRKATASALTDSQGPSDSRQNNLVGSDS